MKDTQRNSLIDIMKGLGMSQSKYMNLGDILTIMIKGFGFASPGMFLLAFWFYIVTFSGIYDSWNFKTT